MLVIALLTNCFFPYKRNLIFTILLIFNAKGLQLRVSISKEQFPKIVCTCPTCRLIVIPSFSSRVNPRGQFPNELWQMDVTHIPAFSQLNKVHVCVDTFSHFVWATAQTSETTNAVILHMYECFAVMGLPKTMKTDNGPGYSSLKFQQFCVSWNIQHITDIPYNPQGQGIVERTHHTLKLQLLKQKEGIEHLKGQLAQTLFTLNFLDVHFMDDMTNAE